MLQRKEIVGHGAGVYGGMLDHPYGERLSESEYMRRITQAHDKVLCSAQATDNEKALDERLMRMELDLAIDFRLGVDFPESKREAMWKIRRRIEKNRLKLVSRYLLGKLTKRKFAQGLQGVAAVMGEEYSEVLSEEEIQAFLGLQPDEIPTLPLNEDQIE